MDNKDFDKIFSDGLQEEQAFDFRVAMVTFCFANIRLRDDLLPCFGLKSD